MYLRWSPHLGVGLRSWKHNRILPHRRAFGSAGTRVKASVAKGSPSPGDVIKAEERAEIKSKIDGGVTSWVLRTFARHLWPDSPAMKTRVAVALSFLVGSKVGEQIGFV